MKTDRCGWHQYCCFFWDPSGTSFTVKLIELSRTSEILNYLCNYVIIVSNYAAHGLFRARGGPRAVIPQGKVARGTKPRAIIQHAEILGYLLLHFGCHKSWLSKRIWVSQSTLSDCRLNSRIFDASLWVSQKLIIKAHLGVTE